MVGDGLTVLIADDDAACRDLFEQWLAGTHEVLTAPDGETALDRLSGAVDVVLLDREMPGKHGTAVAEAIAAGEHDTHVVMVSSKRVDTDLVSVPIDGYVRKPATAADLRRVVGEVRTRREYEAAIDEFFSLTARLAAIEADNDPAALAADERYRRLRWLVDEKRVEVDQALARGHSDWALTFRTFAPDTNPEPVCRRV